MNQTKKEEKDRTNYSWNVNQLSHKRKLSAIASEKLNRFKFKLIVLEEQTQLHRILIWPATKQFKRLLTFHPHFTSPLAPSLSLSHTFPYSYSFESYAWSISNKFLAHSNVNTSFIIGAINDRHYLDLIHRWFQWIWTSNKYCVDKMKNQISIDSIKRNTFQSNYPYAVEW